LCEMPKRVGMPEGGGPLCRFALENPVEGRRSVTRDLKRVGVGPRYRFALENPVESRRPVTRDLKRVGVGPHAQ